VVLLNSTKNERSKAISTGARVGGFAGMLGFYIPLLAGLIELTDLITIALLFFLSSAGVAIIGALLGLLTVIFVKKRNQ